MGKNSIFQNNKMENLKHLEILWSKIDFFNLFQAITFDTFMLIDVFYIWLILGILQENKESNSPMLIQKP